ncbi:MAG: hypothetical protein R3A11_06845 [Bdellovibrionota bacterium]
MKFLISVWALCLGLLVLPGISRSAPWHIEPEIGTSIPVSLGAKVSAMSPLRVGLRTGVGFTPSGYVSIANSVAQSFGAYDDATASLIKAAASNAFYFSTQVVYRFGETQGFEIAAGYSLMSGAGNSSAVNVIEAATGRSFPSAPGTTPAHLQSTLHNLAVDIGYRWVVKDRLQIAGALGLVKPLGSSTSVSVQGAGPIVSQAIENAVDQYLNNIYQQYVYIPTISLGFSYVF